MSGTPDERSRHLYPGAAPTSHIPTSHLWRPEDARRSAAAAYVRWRSTADRILQRPATGRVLVVALLVVAVGLSAWLFPRNIFFFHADWLLHPNEQEHLTIAKHFAETGSLTIEDSWYGQSLGHGSEDKGYLDGSILPRASVLLYFILAVPFLISDTAWLLVTPLFGLAAAAGGGFIVWRRTDSRLAGACAAVALITTASILLNSSGLPTENVISLAFLLAAVFVLERMAARPSAASGAMAGLLFALAAGTRLDLAPAGVIACAFVAIQLARSMRAGTAGRRDIAATGSMLGVFGAAATIGVVFNQIMYGNPLATGYGQQAWQGSASGVGGQLLAFDLGAYKDMAWAFLFRIGKLQTSLLLIGLAWLLWRRQFRAGDIVLLTLSAGLLVLHLGNDGVTGGSNPFLVNSPPRYLQPVYATGVILGIEVAYRAFRALPVRAVTGGVTLALVAVTLISVSASLSEAYSMKWSIPDANRDAKEFRQVYEFSKDHPGAVFVGDYNTKAIISEYTLIPRLIEDNKELADFIRADLEAGRDVYVVDTPGRRDPTNGYYSGYESQLTSEGLALSRVPDTPGFLQVTIPLWTADDIRRLLEEPASLVGEQILANPTLELDGDVLRGWHFNGTAWVVSLPDGTQGVRVRNTAQFGGIRQVLAPNGFAGQTVSGFAAVRSVREADMAAEGVVFGLYDDTTLDPIVEIHSGVLTNTTAYLVFEATLPRDIGRIRLVIASGPRDAGDYIIEAVALAPGTLNETLIRQGLIP